MQNDSETPLALTGLLHIDTVDDLHKCLMDHVAGRGAISLDVSEIESCDAAGLQLLLALKRSADASNKTFAIVAASDALTAIAGRLGVSAAQLGIAIRSTAARAATPTEVLVA